MNQDKENALMDELKAGASFAAERFFGDYAKRIMDEIGDEVIENVVETSGFLDEGIWSDGDIILAFGRVICERLGIEI